MNKMSPELRSHIDKINEYIEKYLSNLNGVDDVLLNAMKYSISPGGKRVRPLLLVLFYELFGGKSPLIYSIASALEMIHTYSLIHDDLPCMDNDTLRRGKECVHIAFGEDVALLCGDAFITQSFEVLFTIENVKEFGSDVILNCAKVLAESAGSGGMVSGQILDMKIGNKPTEEDKIIEMYKNKTGKLFSAAAQMGTICAKQCEGMVNVSKNYGETLGIAFQISDDIIDFDKDSDKENFKATYATLFGKEKASQKLAEYRKAADLLLGSIHTANSSYLSKGIKNFES